MSALTGTGSKVVDLFYNIGASRGKDVVPAFNEAFEENANLALRVAQWVRDVRGGAGERDIFRKILANLVTNPSQYATALALLTKTPELGRWDDWWSVYGLNEGIDNFVVEYIVGELQKGNGLLAKWLPRQKELINGKDLTKALRNRLGMSPKEYRKFLVANTNVVEQYMCSGNWSEINFSHLPSLAHSRYKKAFYKNAEESYKAYVEKLVKKDPTVKINAGAVYPYDVLKGLVSQRYSKGYNATELAVITAQWEALPNYLEDNSVLALVDTSGSMSASVGAGTVSCQDVAVSLGLYVADKLRGSFKDCFLTFSSNPVLQTLSGNIVEKVKKMSTAHWEMSTDLHKAFDLILKTAKNGNVLEEDMPKTLLIMSDMAFNGCVKFDDTAYEMISRKYDEAGYKIPNVVFWNLRATGNAPVNFEKKGVALVSGFSPSILKTVLSAKSVTPADVMLETLMNPRYDI